MIEEKSREELWKEIWEIRAKKKGISLKKYIKSHTSYSKFKEHELQQIFPFYRKLKA